MEASLLIAQILGVTYIVVVGGMVLDMDRYQTVVEDFLESPALTYMGGLLALLFGLVILAFHPQWRMDWTAIITLFGWLALVKGVVLLVWPKALLGLSLSMIKNAGRMKVWAILPLALGVFLAGKGFGLF